MKNRFPPQIKYIVGNEAAERFSFYGMRGILVIFMTQYLHLGEEFSKTTFHLFVMSAYFMPLFGGYLSDRFWGKYLTIFRLSLLYCVGHGVLALMDLPGVDHAMQSNLLYLGLALIAIGSGGIKPCVSAHVGDQFNKEQAPLLKQVFNIFYFSINFGSLFSQLMIPVVLANYGPGWAFGIPGILMAVATFVFWLGRDLYVHVPPTGEKNKSDFIPIVFTGLIHLGSRVRGTHFLDVAKAKGYDDARVEDAKAVVSVFGVFAWITGFWALFDQHGSTWVLQARTMDLHFMGWELLPSQIQALNPLMVMLFIPFLAYWGYPFIERVSGLEMTPLRRMSMGMVMTAFSFLIIAGIQMFLDGGTSVNVVWQVPAYAVITFAEIMVSITGLEFAYTQAPRSMKSTLMSFFFLTIAAGNFLTAMVSYINPFAGAGEFFFYAGLMGVLAVGFILVARNYQVRNYMEEEGAWD